MTVTTFSVHRSAAPASRSTTSAVSIPPTLAYPNAECPDTTAGTHANSLAALHAPRAERNRQSYPGHHASAVNQVVTGTAPTTTAATTAAPIAFVTYNAPATSTTAAQLPFYLPAVHGCGPGGLRHVCRRLVLHAAHRARSLVHSRPTTPSSSSPRLATTRFTSSAFRPT